MLKCIVEILLNLSIKRVTSAEDLLQKATTSIISSLSLLTEPKRFDIIKKDALTSSSSTNIDYFITNPPWTRDILHPLIINLSNQRPTWLLFDADWMHTKQSREYMERCIKIISVGRLKWIPDSKMTGKDNC